MGILFEASDVSRTFTRGDNEIKALDQLCIEINEGDYIALTGPSGCGKTTTLNVLGMLDTDFDGSLEFRGKDVKALGHAEINRLRLGGIGFVFQHFLLLPSLNVIDNVALPCWRLTGSRRQARDRAAALLSRVKLEHRLRHDVRRLSGGEMQRVAVARALVNDPAVVLADEPTGNLDSRSTRAVLNLFREIEEEGRTIVLVTHDPEVVATTRRVMVLKYGRIILEMEPGAIPEIGSVSLTETPWHGIRIRKPSTSKKAKKNARKKEPGAEPEP